MSRMIKVTEADLRAAMRDARYWRRGEPERDRYTAWVTDGFRGLYPSDGDARGAVWVEAYTRDGKQVAAHWRRPPPDSGKSLDDSEQPDSEDEEAPHNDDDNAGIVLANARRGSGRGQGQDQGQPPAGPARDQSRTPSYPDNRRPERRLPDSNGVDRVDDLRADPGTRSQGRLSDGVDQWSRPGGEAGRQQDLDRLRPTGPPTVSENGARTYPLPGGRNATVRSSTTPGSEGLPTLEIGSPRPGAPGRFDATDKFRYPSGR